MLLEHIVCEDHASYTASELSEDVGDEFCDIKALCNELSEGHNRVEISTANGTEDEDDATECKDGGKGVAKQSDEGILCADPSPEGRTNYGCEKEGSSEELCEDFAK